MTTSPSFQDGLPKRTDERIKLSWDFTNRLGSGETISSAVVTATVHEGTDATPSAIVSGSATISGAVVTQLIIDGTSGVTYCLEFAATTSNSQILHGVGLLLVSDEC